MELLPPFTTYRILFRRRKKQTWCDKLTRVQVQGEIILNAEAKNWYETFWWQTKNTKVTFVFNQDGHSWQIDGCRTGAVFLIQRGCWRNLCPTGSPLLWTGSARSRSRLRAASSSSEFHLERSVTSCWSSRFKDLHIWEEAKPRSGERVSARAGNYAPHRRPTFPPDHSDGIQCSSQTRE